MLLDLKFRDFTLTEGGVGVLHWDKSIYKVLCEVPVVTASGILSCELIMTSASEWLQGCWAELLNKQQYVLL